MYNVSRPYIYVYTWIDIHVHVHVHAAHVYTVYMCVCAHVQYYTCVVHITAFLYH